MEGTDPDVDRRTVLRTTAVGIGALALPGVAAADPGKGRGKGRGRGRRGPPEHAGAPVDVALEGGQLQPKFGSENFPGGGKAVGRPPHAAAAAEPEIPEDAERVPDEAIVTAVEELNDAAEAGAVSFEEADGEVTVHVENPAAAARGGDSDVQRQGVGLGRRLEVPLGRDRHRRRHHP